MVGRLATVAAGCASAIYTLRATMFTNISSADTGHASAIYAIGQSAAKCANPTTSSR